MGFITRDQEVSESVRKEQEQYRAQDERTRQTLQQAANAKYWKPRKQFALLFAVSVLNVCLHNPQLNSWVNSWLPFDIQYHPTWSNVYYIGGVGMIVLLYLMFHTWTRFSPEKEAIEIKKGKKSRLH